MFDFVLSYCQDIIKLLPIFIVLRIVFDNLRTMLFKDV